VHQLDNKVFDNIVSSLLWGPY